MSHEWRSIMGLGFPRCSPFFPRFLTFVIGIAGIDVQLLVVAGNLRDYWCCIHLSTRFVAPLRLTGWYLGIGIGIRSVSDRIAAKCCAHMRDTYDMTIIARYFHVSPNIDVYIYMPYITRIYSSHTHMHQLIACPRQWNFTITLWPSVRFVLFLDANGFSLWYSPRYLSLSLSLPFSFALLHFRLSVFCL